MIKNGKIIWNILSHGPVSFNLTLYLKSLLQPLFEFVCSTFSNYFQVLYIIVCDLISRWGQETKFALDFEWIIWLIKPIQWRRATLTSLWVLC